MPSSAAAASEAAKRILRRTTYVEPLSDARAKLADCFNILLGMCKIEGWGAAARTVAQWCHPRGTSWIAGILDAPELAEISCLDVEVFWHEP
jgi:hypothetical protein